MLFVWQFFSEIIIVFILSGVKCEISNIFNVAVCELGTYVPCNGTVHYISIVDIKDVVDIHE